MSTHWEVKIKGYTEGGTLIFDNSTDAYGFYASNPEAEYPVEVEDECCKWCEDGECILRGGIADDDTCDGSIEEQIECGYVDVPDESEE